MRISSSSRRQGTLFLLLAWSLYSPGLAAQILVPSASEWTDHGVIFPAGQPGEWDLYLWGGFTITAVKVGATYHLYYQGSSGYDGIEDTVTGRSIGVATSPNGLNFVKSALNPVLTWHPTCPANDCEEGAASAGAFTGAGGDVRLYYGANTQVSASAVNADGRLATSQDGLNFSDAAVVLNHSDTSLWGFGDELFPIIGLESQGVFVTYYIPNGAGTNRTLGAAWGTDVSTLTQSSQVTSGGTPVTAWGGGAAEQIDETTYAVFVSVVNEAKIDVYTVDIANPHQFTGPVATYAFPGMSQGTVLLDTETSTWFLYYRTASADAYGVKTAPVRTAVPSAPTALRIVP